MIPFFKMSRKQWPLSGRGKIRQDFPFLGIKNRCLSVRSIAFKDSFDDYGRYFSYPINMKFILPQGLVYIGWTTIILSTVCGLLALPLFFIELKEPISSGNEGVTGMAILAFWIFYLLGLSLIVFGKFLGKKPYLKFTKYGAAIFIGQFFIILLLSFIYPESGEWIWKF